VPDVDRSHQMTDMGRVKSAPENPNSRSRQVLIDQCRWRESHKFSLGVCPEAHISDVWHRLFGMKPQPTAKFETFLTIPKVLLKSRLILAES
jgi:hypothetical protein